MKYLKFFTTTTDTVHQNSIESDVAYKINDSENLFQNANKYLLAKKYDSALVFFDFILKDNPMHAGALNGKETIEKHFTEMGNKLMKNGDYIGALEYLKKSFHCKSQ